LVGDGNNIAHSLLLGCSKVGMVATPQGYEPKPLAVGEALAYAGNTGASGREIGGV